MKHKNNLNIGALASTTLVLLLLFFLSEVSAAIPQNNSSNGPYAYITSSGNSTVSVNDPATNTVIATVDAGKSATFGQFINSPSIQPVLPVANFSSNATIGITPLSVQFNDLSDNAAEWNWDFGDGANSTEQSPMHIYSEAGIYIVNLTASNANGTSSKLYTIKVSEQPVKVLPVANFSCNATNGFAPISVQFTDLSENATSWNWDFGDGANSTEQIPEHTYSEEGISTKVLIVSAAPESYATPLETHFRSYPDISTVDFFDARSDTPTLAQLKAYDSVLVWSDTYYQDKIGLGNVLADYVDNGGHVVICTFSFQGPRNDLSGRLISGGYSPLVTGGSSLYSNSTLGWNDSSNPIMSGVSSISGYFRDDTTLTSGATSVAKWADGYPFVATKGNVAAIALYPGVVDQSGRDWAGDVPQLMHNVLVVGRSRANYIVNLTVTNANGSDSKLATITVSAQPIFPVANFSTSVTDGFAPLSIQFTDLSQNETGWSWDFGDGANSTEKSPEHTYSEAGDYIVNLTVSNANGTDSKISEIKVKNSPTGPYAYFTNSGSGTVSVIDTATNNITATIPVGIGPEGVAVSPNGKKVYVTNNESNNISVIDTATNTVESTVNGLYGPCGVAVSPDGKKAYAANSASNKVSVIDTATNTVTALVTVGNGPRGVVVSPDGTKVYVTNQNNNSVSIIDAATNSVIATVDAGSQPCGVAVSPDEKKVYVANYGSNNVSVIDAATSTVSATVPVGPNPVGVAFTPDGTKAYVTNFGSNNVSVIDTATNTITGTVDVGNTPYGVAFTPDGTKAYIANPNSNTVSVLDTATNTLIAAVDAGKSVAFGQFIVPPEVQPVIPVANFITSATSGYEPLSVQFKDTSQNATAWNWDFGDGSNSTEQNPVHIYSTAGNYTITLTASTGYGTDSKLAKINVLPVNGGIEWGQSKQYSTGSPNSIAMDNSGNCIEVHVDSGKLFYRVGQMNFDTKEIKWGPNVQYDIGSSNSISMDDAGHCVEVHVDSGKLFYKVGQVNIGNNTIDWE